MQILILMLGLAIGCSKPEPPQTGLTEAQFVALCVDVLALQSEYAHAPDSVLIARKAVYQKHNITQEEVAQFIATRKANPQTWESVLLLLKEQLGDQAKISPQPFHRAKIDSLIQKKPGQ